MTFDEELIKGKNSFDLLRLLLASAVIVGHAPTLNGTSSFFVDPVFVIFKVEHIHTIAVKLFLFISGVFVTNSLLNGKSLPKYLISRTFRIVPGLAVVLLATAFFIGPFITTRDFNAYLSDPATIHYVIDNIHFAANFSLPGVFESNLYPNAVNGSLWTLYYEVGCYLLILGLFLVLTPFRAMRQILSAILGLIIVDTVFFGHSLFPFLGGNPEVYYLPMMFSLGALLAVNSSLFKTSYFPAIGFGVLWFVFRESSTGHAFFLISVSLLAVKIFTEKFITKIQLPIDISYGVYLWGFITQQVVYFMFGHMIIYTHILISLGITILIAILSAVFVERPSIRLGSHLSKRITANVGFILPVRPNN